MSHVFRVHRPVHRQHPLVVRLASGFRRFQHRWYHPQEPLFEELRLGQKPLALVIACSDSRVDPVLLTDSRPGDLFVVRNVANLVHPYQPGGGAIGLSAALEYAVKHLKVKDIIVMGHACCGGIHALVSARARWLAGELRRESEEDEFIASWVSVALRALEKADEEMPGADIHDLARACELWSIRLSLDNLLTFPWVEEAVESGELTLHGWYFDLQSGELLEFDGEEETFRHLVHRLHRHEGPGHLPEGAGSLPEGPAAPHEWHGPRLQHSRQWLPAIQHEGHGPYGRAIWHRGWPVTRHEETECRRDHAVQGEKKSGHR